MIDSSTSKKRKKFLQKFGGFTFIYLLCSRESDEGCLLDLLKVKRMQ